jgi:hypothetical protein
VLEAALRKCLIRLPPHTAKLAADWPRELQNPYNPPKIPFLPLCSSLKVSQSKLTHRDLMQIKSRRLDIYYQASSSFGRKSPDNPSQGQRKRAAIEASFAAESLFAARTLFPVLCSSLELPRRDAVEAIIHCQKTPWAMIRARALGCGDSGEGTIVAARR